MPKYHRFSFVRQAIVALVLVVSCAIVPAIRPSRVDAAPGHAAASFTSLPLRFELNEGQDDGSARFLARTRDGVLAITPTEVLLAMRRAAPRRDRAAALRQLPKTPPVEEASAVVRIAMEGSNSLARVVGLEQLPGVTNYFIGNDPSKWRTKVPGYAKVNVEGVYPGVDMLYYGNGGALEYDFDIAPGADPHRIALSVDGADSVAVDSSGDLILRTVVGEVRQHAPKIYQDVDGVRREVAGGYTIRSKTEVGFDLAAYDASRPLVIDPQLVYATYLGGNFIDGDIASLAVDASGSAYVCGSTQSTDFPTEHPFQGVKHANETAFVTKLSPDGSSLVYSTYLGGSLFDLGWGIAVNSAGEAYVTGTTSSDDFPVNNAFQPQRGFHSSDVWIARLSADGSSLVYSSFLGGTGEDTVTGITLDADSNAYVCGYTSSTDFPVKLASQVTYGGGANDGFAAIVAASGSTLLSATYFGGEGDDQIQSIALDPMNNRVYLTGFTETSTSLGASPARRGASTIDYFELLAVLDFYRWLEGLETGEAFESDIPGRSSQPPQIFSRVVAQRGVLLRNQSPSRMRTTGTPSPQLGAFVSIVDQNLQEIASGGLPIASGQNFLGGLVAGPDGALYAAGATDSDLLPLHDPMQGRRTGGFDIYVVVFAPGSLAPVFSTYLGGSDDDFNWGIALDPQGNIYVVGSTSSTDFPTAGEPFQSTAPPLENAFVAKISPVTFAPDFGLAADPPTLTASRGQKGQITIDVGRTGGFSGNVEVTAPATAAIKVKLKPASASTTGDHVTFSYKVKKKAQPGTYDLIFTGTDDQNRERSATLSLTVQ